MFGSGKFLKFLIIIQFNQMTQGWFIDYSSYEDECNEDFIKFIDIRLIEISNRKVINGSVILKKELDKFDITFLITSPRRNAKPFTLLNVTLDGCAYLKKSQLKNVNFPYIFLTEIIASNPNFPIQCPVEKVRYADKEIEIRNLYMSSERIPIKFPEWRFTSSFLFSRARVQFLKMIVNGTVKKGK
ncbi:uncharacterized protein LOC119603335 [Lucilia sericata]|uniref:uncharacterized protein LOC119603335 n=1 Tax=Lucilia sericata TaxID=13632 RepID=UPI0018A825EF|nr:uncharacterized protein LOC119603335 [Lucilia sericata]